jgi:hypothetical protein
VSKGWARDEADPKGKRLDVGEVLEKAGVYEARTTLYMLQEPATRRDPLHKLPSKGCCFRECSDRNAQLPLFISTRSPPHTFVTGNRQRNDHDHLQTTVITFGCLYLFSTFDSVVIGLIFFSATRNNTPLQIHVILAKVSEKGATTCCKRSREPRGGMGVSRNGEARRKVSWSGITHAGARKMEASKSSAALNRACAHKLKRRREETSSTEAEAETY